jgi:PAS domain-containing protein
VRNAAGAVDGIFVLATDVTDRAKAEAALRITNWQLTEERARLASTVEAEQRARAALRRFSDSLEAHVQQRTAQLERTLHSQSAIADRLRATFETSLIFQGYLDPKGTLLDANMASLASIDARLNDVVGLPFWETPWFAATPGLPLLVRDAVARAGAGEAVQAPVEANLPAGPRKFQLSLRPVQNAQGEVIGIVPQAVDITDRA